MPEINPQSEARLREALRRLGASSRQSAGPEIGAGLLQEFRRHHARRRMVRRTGIAALAAGIALAAGLVSLHKPTQSQNAGTPSIAVPPRVSDTPAKPAASVQTASAPTKPHARGTSANNHTATNATVAGNRQFLALPGYDPAVPPDQLQVVRVQLPASALWQIGAPISADAGPQKMTADFVVSQDGTPYAVRLVQ